MRSLALVSLLVSTALAAPLNSRSDTARRGQSLSIPCTQKLPSAKRLLSKRQATGTPVSQQSTIGNENDVRYIAAVTIAGESLNLIIDTGSTDTFVFSVEPEPFVGLDPSELPPLFNNGTAQGVINTGVLYNASYGGGDSTTSTLGDIELATLTLPGTTLTATNLTFANIWQSDETTGASGLLGFGFPFNGVIYETILLGFAYSQQPLTAAQSQAFFPLVPLLNLQNKITQPIFSLVVDRLGPARDAPQTSDSVADFFNVTFSNGTLTIGDYPAGYTQADFTFSPVPVVSLDQDFQAAGFPNSTGNRWSIPLEGIYFNGKLLTNTTQQPDFATDGNQYYSLIDSGNPSLVFPMDVIQQIVPNGAYAANAANAVMPCNTPFDLVLQYAGKNYSLNPIDTLVPSYLASDSLGYGGSIATDCQFQAQPETPSPDEVGPGTALTYQFGDPFLRNVAIVFDYGNLLNSAQTPPRIGLASRS